MQILVGIAAKFFSYIAAILWLAAATGSAQEFRSHPVTIVVPYPPASVMDLVARRMAEHLSTAWAQAVVIENRSGADGILGSTTVARARPDEYTLLITKDAVVTSNLYLHEEAPYSVDNFASISVLCQITSGLAVSPSLGVNSFAELVSFAKSWSDEIAYASFGNGIYANLSMEELKQSTDIDLNHVTYKGAVPTVAATISGETGIPIIDCGNIGEHVKQEWEA